MSNSKFTDPPQSLYQADDPEWREAHDRPLPADLRDEIQSGADALRQPTDAHEQADSTMSDDEVTASGSSAPRSGTTR